MVVVVLVVAVCFGGMRGQSTVGPVTPVKTLASSPRRIVKQLSPPRTMRRKKKPTVKTAVKRVHMERKVMTAEKDTRRHVMVHNTTVVQQGMDKSNVWPLQPWMELLTGTTTTPQVKKPKMQLAKRVEWLIVESHKLRWKGQRFLI
jgi:hypothetical protein